MAQRITIDKVVRSQRKTMALHIGGDAKVTLRVPERASDRGIKRFLAQHARWIVKHKAQAVRRGVQVAKKYLPGERFLYLGVEYPLSLAQQTKAIDWSSESGFTLAMDASGEEAFTSWYREAARAVITERVNFYSNANDLPYGQLRITSAKGRWGSCGKNNSLNFAWRLVMMPLPVVDYVVAHELAHTKHKNHSQAFWHRVAHIYPDFKKHNQWLRKNGHRISM